jgi:hypothetical protein
VLRSPLIRAVLATAALIVFYLLGVAARQHYGSCVDLRNLSGKTVRQVRVTVESGGKTYDLPDLEPGDHKRVYVQPAEKSEVTLRIDDGMSKPRTSTYLDMPSPTIAASRWCRFCRSTTRERMRFTGRCAGRAGWTSYSSRPGFKTSRIKHYIAHSGRCSAPHSPLGATLLN